MLGIMALMNVVIGQVIAYRVIAALNAHIKVTQTYFSIFLLTLFAQFNTFDTFQPTGRWSHFNGVKMCCSRCVQIMIMVIWQHFSKLWSFLNFGPKCISWKSTIVKKYNTIFEYRCVSRHWKNVLGTRAVGTVAANQVYGTSCKVIITMTS